MTPSASPCGVSPGGGTEQGSVSRASPGGPAFMLLFCTEMLEREYLHGEGDGQSYSGLAAVWTFYSGREVE